MTQPILISREDAAAQLGISVMTLGRLINRGELVAIQMGEDKSSKQWLRSQDVAELVIKKYRAAQKVAERNKRLHKLSKGRKGGEQLEFDF